MTTSAAVSPRIINRISLIIVTVGFAAAGLIWAIAPASDSDALRDDPLGQRRYRRELRVIGGQANQLSADFLDWFGGLWGGRNLAYTVATLSVASMLGFRFVAVRNRGIAPGDPSLD